jgi:cytochrome c oxidase cbb3-type subunit 3
MKRIRTLAALAVVSLVTLVACDAPDGQPQSNSEPIAPSQVLDFSTLYAQNCAGCHGAQGRGGAAIG